jgi:hypothetical protein
MSGLILPGGKGKGAPPPDDASKTTGGSGLILPPGAGRKKPADSAPAESAPAGAAPAAQAQAPAPAGAGRRISADDLLFPPQGAQVQCPNCGTPYVVPVFSIIDLGANPELKQPLLGGQINTAVCQACGAGGAVSAPLMVHVPEKQWLGVVIPAEARMNEVQQQKIIGEMTQALMRKLPQEQRKGYLLQPKQYHDWQRFTEQLWEFEGVTAEMIRRQRAQTELMQSLLSLADDRKALEMAIGRTGDLIDRQFFVLFDRLMMMLNAQGQEAEGERFMQLREALLELTPAGKEVAAQQERIGNFLKRIEPGTTHGDLVSMLVDLWQEPDGRDVGAAVMMGVPALFDYEFLLEVSARLEKEPEEGEKKALEEMREIVMMMQQQMQESRQQGMQQAQEVLAQVLQAEDLNAALRQNAEFIDEMFLSLLVANIQQAQKNNSKGAVRRLQAVYDATMELLQEGLPPELQLINRLLGVATDKPALNAMLEENRPALTPDFVEAMRSMEAEMRATGRPELADRVKQVRAQVALKM